MGEGLNMLRELTLCKFVAAVSSASPAPGGGSVAALAGAEGFALLGMVANLTLGRDKFAAVQAEMKELLVLASARQLRLLELVDEDTEGFAQVMTALALPRDNDEEKALRRAELEKATLKAARVPLETARLCLEGLRQLSGLLTGGNPNALSDMGVAGLSLQSGLEGALFNVQINALALKDGAEKGELLQVCQTLRIEGRQLADAAQEEVLKRLS